MPDRFGAFPSSDALRNKHYEIHDMISKHEAKKLKTTFQTEK